MKKNRLFINEIILENQCIARFRNVQNGDHVNKNILTTKEMFTELAKNVYPDLKNAVSRLKLLNQGKIKHIYDSELMSIAIYLNCNIEYLTEYKTLENEK